LSTTFSLSRRKGSDLAKYLYGSRSLHKLAAEACEDFREQNPRQIPVVYNGMLWTGSDFEAAIAERDQEALRVKQAKQEAARKRRQDWQNASPMVAALREAGLA
jgi:hypothetical protein